MAAKVACPGCGKVLTIPAGFKASYVGCKACGHKWTIQPPDPGKPSETPSHEATVPIWYRLISWDRQDVANLFHRARNAGSAAIGSVREASRRAKLITIACLVGVVCVWAIVKWFEEPTEVREVRGKAEEMLQAGFDPDSCFVDDVVPIGPIGASDHIDVYVIRAHVWEKDRADGRWTVPVVAVFTVDLRRYRMACIWKDGERWATNHAYIFEFLNELDKADPEIPVRLVDELKSSRIIWLE